MQAQLAWERRTLHGFLLRRMALTELSGFLFVANKQPKDFLTILTGTY
jgi:hypothetical protein